MSDNPYKTTADFLLRTLIESALPRLDDGREVFRAAITSVLEDEAIVSLPSLAANSTSSSATTGATPRRAIS